MPKCASDILMCFDKDIGEVVSILLVKKCNVYAIFVGKGQNWKLASHVNLNFLHPHLPVFNYAFVLGPNTVICFVLQQGESYWRELDKLVWVDSRKPVKPKLSSKRCGMGRKVC